MDGLLTFSSTKAETTLIEEENTFTQKTVDQSMVPTQIEEVLFSTEPLNHTEETPRGNVSSDEIRRFKSQLDQVSAVLSVLREQIRGM